MKIGIISDTHKKVKKTAIAISTLLADGAEFLLHAGDIVEPEVLELLKSSGVRYVAVYGNNDDHLKPLHNEYNLVAEPHYFKLAQKTFKLMHLPYYLNGDVDIVVFGHTHRVHVEYNSKTLFINSGEVCARDSGISSWSMLEVFEDRYELTNYARAKKSDDIVKSTQRIEYE